MARSDVSVATDAFFEMEIFDELLQTGEDTFRRKKFSFAGKDHCFTTHPLTLLHRKDSRIVKCTDGPWLDKLRSNTR